jgi:ABC-type dipeptide/oligopeptide/nickel transport system permease subunit
LLGTVVVYTTLAVPGIMLTESTLSFIGLGVRAPNSSWGTLIKEGADRMEATPELLIFPALFFCVIFTYIFAQLSAKFANKASPTVLNRVTGIVLTVLGVLMFVVKGL